MTHEFRSVPTEDFLVFLFLFSNKNFFLPFLWQVGEFSLVCEEGREVCSAHVALSQPFMSYSNREKRDLKEEEEERQRGRICRMYL